MPIKPLSFKGDKKAKKRKHREHDNDTGEVSTATARTTRTGEEPEDDDTWTTPDAASDLSGPVILVLPTTPATCLASDAHGNVFASAVENMVENHVETAEPHDVRQVWVANQVAGSGQLSFKASHGGFLSCDSVGVLGARREARGVEEGFEVEEVGTSSGSGSGNGRTRWRVKTSASRRREGAAAGGDRYLAAVVVKQEVKKEEEDQDDDSEHQKKKQSKSVEISLRGDGEAGEAATELVIKMQARFKPRVQQNKASRAQEKVSRREMEQAVGRRLDEDEVKRLKRARKNGTYHEELLDVRVKGKHDKFA